MRRTHVGSAENAISREAILVGVVIVITLLGLLFLSSQRQQVLRQSPSGLDGLAIWLNAQDQNTQGFSGGWRIDTKTLGLNIIPLYDSDLGAVRAAPKSQEELLFQRDENDRVLNVVRQKISAVKTLIVLPKWRSGMRLTGIAHPALLIDQNDTGRLLQDLLGQRAGEIRHVPRPFSDFDYEGADGVRFVARLYVAQVFMGAGCDPIIGTENAMVLAECPIGVPGDNRTVIILSDPDLINNHGLRLGDNAEIARDFLTSHANGKQILIDYSRENWLWKQAENEVRERTWADLLQFFSYPFSVIWAGSFGVMGLVLWRAGVRFGPISGSAQSLSASKLQMIRARSRLLRLTDEDGALLREYTRARLATTATQVFGNTYAHRLGGKTILMRRLDQRDPKLAQNLRALLATINALPSSIPAREAIAYVDKLEQILEQITDDT